MTMHMATLSLTGRRRLSLLALLVSGAAWAQPAPAPTPAATAPTSAAPATSPTPPRHLIAELQVLPRPLGTAEDRYKHVDAAIAVIQASGLRYEVHALGTIVEGPPEKIWPLLQAVHEATLAAGAERTLSLFKVSGGAQAGGIQAQDLVKKFRP